MTVHLVDEIEAELERAHACVVCTHAVTVHLVDEIEAELERKQC